MTELYYVSLSLQCVYGCIVERGVNWNEENESKISGGGGERGDCLASFMQIIWFCMVSRRKT